MKSVFVVIIALVGLAVTGCSARQLKKSAGLFLPLEVTIHDGDADPRPIVKFRWDESESVAVKLMTVLPGSRSYVIGSLRVFDAAGNEMIFQGLDMRPFGPTGTREVRKGESLELPLASSTLNSLKRSGRYYAIAAFSGITSRGAIVTFTTEKQWFQLHGER